MTAITVLVNALTQSVFSQELPSGYWDTRQISPVLEQTLDVYLDADISHLSSAERASLEKLIEAGKLFHELYLAQKHKESQSAFDALMKLETKDHRQTALRQLFWLFKGPVGTTLDNKRQAFLPVSDEVPGKTVYPHEIDRESIESFIDNDEALRAQLLHDRSVVRKATEENLQRHRKTLNQWPLLAQLNSSFSARLDKIKVGQPQYYAVPYAVEYAAHLSKIYVLLTEAAELIDSEDNQFAGYLRHRARDLLHSDYEAGDAAWVTGRFNNLNAQIGSYETYDDTLFGAKAFYSMSILARDEEKSAELKQALQYAQEIENSLPYDNPKTIKSDIPVHVSNVVADFGQARGTNTATILPNDPEHSRKYGRTILLRNNIMRNPTLYEGAKVQYEAAMAPEFHQYLSIDSTFQRTLWHEVGHYLGVDQTIDGRNLDIALQNYADLLEEMKSDLVSLFASKKLYDGKIYSKAQLDAIYANGILRVLQLVKPRPTQPYQTMQLIQWNYFLEHGLLSFDNKTQQLSIDFDRYHKVVTELLRMTLDVQYQGDVERAEKFVKRYTEWDEQLHGVIAANMVERVTHRYRLVHYSILD